MHTTAKELWTGRFAQENGIVLLDEGTYQFPLSNGACFSIHASPYTPRYGVSAFQYPSREDKFNSKASGILPYAINVSTEQSIIPAMVDIVMTHGPPKYIWISAVMRTGPLADANI